MVSSVSPLNPYVVSVVSLCDTEPVLESVPEADTLPYVVKRELAANGTLESHMDSCVPSGKVLQRFI